MSGVGDVDRCELKFGSSDEGCGRRCAYMLNDPNRCQGRTTVDVAEWGQAMNTLP